MKKLLITDNVSKNALHLTDLISKNFPLVL